MARSINQDGYSTDGLHLYISGLDGSYNGIERTIYWYIYYEGDSKFTYEGSIDLANLTTESDTFTISNSKIVPGKSYRVYAVIYQKTSPSYTQLARVPDTVGVYTTVYTKQADPEVTYIGYFQPTGTLNCTISWEVETESVNPHYCYQIVINKRFDDYGTVYTGEITYSDSTSLSEDIDFTNIGAGTYRVTIYSRNCWNTNQDYLYASWNSNTVTSTRNIEITAAINPDDYTLALYFCNGQAVFVTDFPPSSVFAQFYLRLTALEGSTLIGTPARPTECDSGDAAFYWYTYSVNFSPTLQYTMNYDNGGSPDSIYIGATSFYPPTSIKSSSEMWSVTSTTSSLTISIEGWDVVARVNGIKRQGINYGSANVTVYLYSDSSCSSSSYVASHELTFANWVNYGYTFTGLSSNTTYYFKAYMNTPGYQLGGTGSAATAANVPTLCFEMLYNGGKQILCTPSDITQTIIRMNGTDYPVNTGLYNGYTWSVHNVSAYGTSFSVWVSNGEAWSATGETISDVPSVSGLSSFTITAAPTSITITMSGWRYATKNSSIGSMTVGITYYPTGDSSSATTVSVSSSTLLGTGHTISGLSETTSYTLIAKVGVGGTLYEILNTTVTTTSSRPSDWSWENTHGTGSAATTLTATEWGHFTARINLFEAYLRGTNSTYNSRHPNDTAFTSVSSGNTLTAAIYNQVRDAIFYMYWPDRNPATYSGEQTYTKADNTTIYIPPRAATGNPVYWNRTVTSTVVNNVTVQTAYASIDQLRLALNGVA